MSRIPRFLPRSALQAAQDSLKPGLGYRGRRRAASIQGHLRGNYGAGDWLSARRLRRQAFGEPLLPEGDCDLDFARRRLRPLQAGGVERSPFFQPQLG